MNLKDKQIVIGIFVSFDELCPNSDLDIFIVTNERHVQIIGKVIDGIELECCYKPLEQYHYDIDIIKQPVDIQRYANGEILYDPAGEAQQIISKANQTFAMGPNSEITDSDLYHLNDKFLDLEDRIHTTCAPILLYKAFEQLMIVYFKKENLWGCKASYYINCLKSHNSQFGELAEEFLTEQNIQEQHKKLIILKDIVLEGVRKLDKNWKTDRFNATVFNE